MIYIDIHDAENFVASFEFDNKFISIIKQLPNRTYDKKIGVWIFPIIDLFILKKLLKAEEVGIDISPAANKKYMEVAEKFKGIRDIADATDTEYKVHGLKKEVKLYPFQRVGIEYLDMIRDGLVGFDMGLGKFQSLDSKLLSNNGWIRMGDVKIGDKIFGSDGLAHDVTGVFPQGLQDCYEVEFTDGSKTTSGDEHLWSVQSPCQKLRGTGFKTKQLKEFKNDLHEKNRNTKWFIPITKSIKFNKAQLSIDPYVLGVLIGDGSLTISTQFTSADKFIAEELSRLVPKDTHVSKLKSKYLYSISGDVHGKNALLDEIKKYGLNHHSYEKFIPDIYKFSSIDQRIAMLQGLMDTDGGVDTKKDGIVISYSSTSEKLIDDLRFIVESLGGTGKKTTRVTSYTHRGVKKQGRRSWRLNISLPPDIEPFRLPRKLKIYTPRSKYKPYRGVKSVTYIGKKECQCITISSPDHLYITDHCILTHNTAVGISIASNAFHDKTAKQVLIICPASLKYEWAYQIAKFSKYAYTIVGGKDREAQYRKKTPFIIVNYDLLYRDIELIKDIDWDIVICDEIQRARNYKTDTVKSLLQLKCKRKIGLTGTPIENDLLDLFTIMKFLNPKIFGKNVTSFIGRYCTLDYFGRINHDKYKNLDEVTKKVSFAMIRRKKRDVLDDLPEKVVNHFYITLSKDEMKKYKEIKSGILEDINSGKIKTIAALAQVGYLRQACDSLNLVVENQKVISSKLDEVKQILKDLPEDSKIVLFTQYERMAKIIEDNIGYKSVHLHGGVDNGCRWEKEIEEDTLKKNKKMASEELDVLVYEERLKAVCPACPYYNDESKCHTRKKIVSKFNNEKDIKLFISTDAGKAGLNLQVANVVINYDMSFNPAVNEQRIARIDRIGQTSLKILVINLICVDTIEEKVLKILEKKQLLFDKVIDGADEGESMKIIFNEQNIKDLL